MNECNTYSEIFNFNLKESQITDVLFVGPWLRGQGVVAWGVPNGNSSQFRVHAHAHVEIMKIFSVFFRESLVKDRFQQRGIILKIYTLKWFPASPSIRKVCVMAFQNSLAICMMRFYKVKGTWKTHFEESSLISIQFNKSLI